MADFSVRGVEAILRRHTRPWSSLVSDYASSATPSDKIHQTRPIHRSRVRPFTNGDRQERSVGSSRFVRW